MNPDSNASELLAVSDLYDELATLILGTPCNGVALAGGHPDVLKRLQLMFPPQIDVMYYTIITTWFDEKDPTRLKEMVAALERNLALGGPVVVLAELVGPPITHPQLDVRIMKNRPMFIDAVKACPAGTMVAIINSDCYFEKRPPLRERMMAGEVAWCLSRHEVGPPIKRMQGKWSQDAWVFKVPEMTAKKPLAPCQFHFGKLACDNAFAATLHLSGFRLENPCDDIRVIHVHNSPVRHYTIKDRLPEPWVPVQPCPLGPT